MANLSGETMHKKYSYVEGGVPMNADNLPEMYLNNTWRPNLSITGAAGLPDVSVAGNVVRQSTSVKLSMRLPPSKNPAEAEAKMLELLTTNVPHNAKVTAKGGHRGQGWCMKDLPDWFNTSMKQAGAEFFDGKETGSYGMGGSIPFLAELGKMYPNSIILALGLIGPYANAHGPDEAINLPFAKKLTMALSHLIAEVSAHEE